MASRKVNGENLLYASDSTVSLKEIDLKRWKTIRKIDVRDAVTGNLIPALNELEIIKTNAVT